MRQTKSACNLLRPSKSAFDVLHLVSAPVQNGTWNKLRDGVRFEILLIFTYRNKFYGIAVIYPAVRYVW